MVFPLKFEFFWLSSGLGGRLSLTLLNRSEWRIQIMSGVIVIVGVIGDDYQLILKNNYKVFSVTSDFLNQIHATQKLFRPWTQDEYKISDCDLLYLLMWHYNQYLVKACPRRSFHVCLSWAQCVQSLTPKARLSLFTPSAQVIVTAKIKPWCTLGPSCGPRAGVLLHH
jgi:hypothetical protein